MTCTHRDELGNLDYEGDEGRYREKIAVCRKCNQDISDEVESDREINAVERYVEELKWK